MKTIKFILSAILMMMAFTIQAQTIQVYKDGVVVKEYPASEVKSVEIKPVYYYYIGWKCPKNEDELASMATGVNGGYLTSLTGLDTNKDYYPQDLTGTRTQWYLVIPSTLNAYDVVTGGLMTDNTENMIKENNQPIANYTIWKSIEPSKYIGGLKIY